MRAVLCLLLCLAGAPVAAEEFRILLGGRELGRLDYAPGRIDSRLDNTPLGAADGTFRARMAGGDYVAVSEERRIEVDFAGGRAVETRVVPEDERTALSDPARVPAGVLDPVTGLGRVIGATDCPAPFRMYDGRRAIQVTPSGRAIEGGTLICHMDYTVIAGPGHVSPFRLERLRLEARYALSDGRVAGLAMLVVRAGPFAVTLMR